MSNRAATGAGGNDVLDAGLLLASEVAGADAVAVFIAESHGRPRLAAERMWAASRHACSERLWGQADAGADGPLLDPPVLALPVRVGAELVGMLCVEISEHLEGRATRVGELIALARILVEICVFGPRQRQPPSLAAIHRSADPAAALTSRLAVVHGNVSQLARNLRCTRKAIYAAAERYGVRLAHRIRRR
jgi:hypothetical protein